MSLESKIVQQIANDGPLSLAQYMDICLNDTVDGYYRNSDPLGPEGDFITSPEISQMFGELIGAWLATGWQAIGSPENTNLVELGPGRGTLMDDAIRATTSVENYHKNISIHLVEVNRKLKEHQKKLLAKYNITTDWHEHFEDIPDGPVLIIANEFFDALPVHQFIMEEGEWRERLIGLDENEHLTYQISPAPTPFCAHIPKEKAEAENGSIYEISPQAVEIVKAIANRIKRNNGLALIIDYGYLEPTNKDTFQAIKNQAYHNPLEKPGEADLTTHVNFPSLEQAATEENVRVYSNVLQGELLIDLGIQLRATMLAKKANKEQKQRILSEVTRLIHPDQMGTLFKCMAIVHPDAPPPFGFL